MQEMLSMLSPVDLFAGIGAASRDLREVAKSLVLQDTGYTQQFLGHVPLKAQASGNLLPFVIAAHVAKPKIFKFGVHFTDGGVFFNTKRFWAQNAFEYTGAVYTTNEVTENVTVAATYLGEYINYRFDCKVHEDLYGLLELGTTWNIPERYKKNILPSDTFLNGSPPRLGESFSADEYSAWSKEEGPIAFLEVEYSPPLTFTSNPPISSEYALATHVGVARPAYATCPVHTLLISTALGWRCPDQSRYYGLSSLEAVLARTDLPPIVEKNELSGFVYVEFEASEGPLLWVQFTAYQCNQVEIALKTRRVLKFTELLLIDMEDRRVEFGTREKGIDITYVLFAGKSLPQELKEVLDVPEDLQENDMQTEE